MKMNPVVHFEMPYGEPKRVAKFYETVFGWGMQYLPKMGNYVLAATSPMTKDNMHKNKGAINGGFFPKGDYGNVPHVVISVDNLKKSMNLVKKSGGKIQGEPIDIPQIGKFIMFEDTEGNKVGMLQPVS